MGDANFQLFRFMADNFGIETFVETGSAHGATALGAINIFPYVHTIELSNIFYKETLDITNGAATCHYGESADVMRNILPGIYGPVLYWLDAHWSGGESAGKSNQCPLMTELEIINNRPANSDYIIIDDAHVFLSKAVLKPPNDVSQWPGIQQIFERLNAKNRYVFILSSWRCREHGIPGGIVFPEDMIIAVPRSAETKVDQWLLGLNLEC